MPKILITYEKLIKTQLVLLVAYFSSTSQNSLEVAKEKVSITNNRWLHDQISVWTTGRQMDKMYTRVAFVTEL